MRWPWQRREDDRMEDRQQRPTDLGGATTIEEARAARRRSEAGLDEARQRDPAVRRLAGSLRSHRTDRFAGEMDSIFREHRA